MQKWAILQSAMPIGITLKKTIALVMAIMKLHNFCIDKVDRVGGAEDATTRTSSDVDSFHVMNHDEGGFVPLVNVAANDVTANEIIPIGNTNANVNEVVPTELLGYGHHFNDVPQRLRNPLVAANYLPRTVLHDKVLNLHKVRPSTRSKHQPVMLM